MIEQIKKRVKAWKRLYARGCKDLDENSSWHEILMELEYYRSSQFYTSGWHKLREASETIGVFTTREQEFLDSLPAYALVKMRLKFDDFRENYADKIDGLKVYSVCSAQDDEIPLREYTVITDREELWGLEIYVFRDSPCFKCRRHGIIRYDKEAPDNYVAPEYDLT